MKVLVVLAFLLAGSLAAPPDSCENSFGAFLKALNDEVMSKGKAMETEFRDDYYKLARRCFASSWKDDSRCVLTDDELKGDVFGDNGPMKGCMECQMLGAGWRDQLYRSDFATRKCYRTRLAYLVGQALEPCIQGKVSKGGSFKVPLIPDFCEEGLSSLIEQGISARIAVKSRLHQYKVSHPTKYQSTVHCMEKKGHSDIYDLHRLALRVAKEKAVPSSCSPRFEEVKNATCRCVEEIREQWNVRFDKVQEIITSAKSADECGRKINDVLGFWFDSMEKVVSDCAPKGSKLSSLAFRPLIKLGCDQVAEEEVKNKMIVGFRFIRFFLDATDDRVTVYCDRNCNSRGNH